MAENPYSPPPGIGFSYVVCHLPLSQQADGFKLLIDSGSSKHLFDPELNLAWRRAAGDNILHGTAQGVSVVVVRGTDDVLRKVKLSKV